MAEDRKPVPRKDGDKPRKREYRRPALIEYGPISKLTRSGGASRTEAGAPRMKQICL